MRWFVGWSGVAAGLLVGICAAAARAGSPPTVSNVAASQRTDGSKIVDIYFDLADADGNACIVSVEASADGGATWTVPVATTEGDVGPGVWPGSGRHIAWWCAADLPGAAGSDFRVRVWAEDPPGPCGAMVTIDASGFAMGDLLVDGHSDEQPAHWASLSSFYIDACEVTNADYVQMLNDIGLRDNLVEVGGNGVVHRVGDPSTPYCDTTASSRYSRITWDGATFDVRDGYDDHPVVCVSWYGAAAFANWRSIDEGYATCYDTWTWDCDFFADGYRLPTEAEWEFAARGGSFGMRYPWADTREIQHTRANYCSDAQWPYDTSPTRGYHPTFRTGGYPYTSPVGYFAPNAFGLYDMAGNVWEWCHDWYSHEQYGESAWFDPVGPPTGTCHVLRGGSWYNNAYACRVANRYHYTGHYQHMAIGFRLVRGLGSE
jgi:sulfatase modifying factor 1